LPCTDLYFEKMKNKTRKEDQMKRVHKQSFLLNELEMRAINRYCKKYKVSNRSRFIRETIVTAILKKFDDDHPTLFDLDASPDLFSGQKS
jgi:hypothetical protein